MSWDVLQVYALDQVNSTKFSHFIHFYGTVEGTYPERFLNIYHGPFGAKTEERRAILQEKSDEEADLFTMLGQRSSPGVQYFLNELPVDGEKMRGLVEEDKQTYMLSDLKVDEDGRIDRVYFHRISEK